MKIANGIWGFAALAVVYMPLFAQVNFTPTIDLKIGTTTGPLLVSIPGSDMEVVYTQLPHTAMCPTVVPGDFQLKKLNSSAGPATQGFIRGFCNGVDSTSINTEVVYEIYTWKQEVYYMQLLELLENKKVKVRITSEPPVVGIRRGESPGSKGLKEGQYFVDGKTAPVTGAKPSGAKNVLLGSSE